MGIGTIIELGVRASAVTAYLAILPQFIQGLLGAAYVMVDGQMDQIGQLANPAWFVEDSSTVLATFKATAYSLAVLYFLIELIGQIISLDKMSAETIIRMLVKLFVAQILIQNADKICQGIYATFRGLSGTAEGITGLIRTGSLPPIGFDLMFGADTMNKLNAVGGVIEGFLAAATVVPGGGLPLLISPIVILVVFLLMLLITAFAFIKQYVTLYLRLIEIAILTLISPLAMAGASSSEFKGVTKKFLVNFATICLEGVIIILGVTLIKDLMPSYNPTNGLTLAGVTFNVDDANMLSFVLYLVPFMMRISLTTTLISKARSFAQAVLQG